MPDCQRFQFGLACLIMAAFCGLAGFLIVYHYASSERPIEQFAIIIDAGSTQTRSSLFMISLDVDRMLEWTSEGDEDEDDSKNKPLLLANVGKQSLSKVIEVRQVSSCVNGGPVALLTSERDAIALIDKCLRKFTHHIRRLDFINSEYTDKDEEDLNKLEEESAILNSDEVAERLALLNHRVNSLTQLHLGATAGMRALSVINETSARQKIGWMDSAATLVNKGLQHGIFINKGYINTISGSDEAAFGWASVNFVCDKLQARHKQPKHSLEISNLKPANKTSYADLFDLDKVKISTSHPVNSIGIVELGGASAQIAYEVSEMVSKEKIQNISMDSHELDLFNAKYKLATRSDLCLGMSQAILRLKFVLLTVSLEENDEKPLPSLVEIINPCFQKGSLTDLSSSDVSSILDTPCLLGSQEKSSVLNKTLVENKTAFRFLGTGNTEQCGLILSKLIDPIECNKHFSICPKNPNKLIAPPKNMPFVTISGYNKALQVLNLKKKLEFMQNDNYDNRIEPINDKLGGYSIDYLEFVDETRNFCSIDVSDFPNKFPQMHKAYYSVNCLQLIYINKLLTEFYKFDPLSSWQQLKFLLFPVKPSQQQQQQQQQQSDNKLIKAHEDKNDIGWSLGLLLNATSRQFSGDKQAEVAPVFYHHGASIVFILRATVFLMLACCLLAICFIVLAILGEASQNSEHRQSYIDHSEDGYEENQQQHARVCIQ